MSSEERRTWAYGLVAVLGYLAYVAVLLVRGRGAPLPEAPWVGTMLGAVLGAALVGAVAQAVVASTCSPDTVSDARDSEILRTGELVGRTMLIGAAVVALGLSMLEADHFWIANALYLGFVLAAVLSCAVRLAAYRRGLPLW